MAPASIPHLDIESPLDGAPPGERWHARDRRDGRRVTVRLVPAPPSERPRLLAGVRVVGAVRHPNLERVLGSGEYADGVYVVSEPVAGATLARRLGRGPLPLAATVRMGLDALEALAALHRKGLVHGHLSSDRVFREEDGRIVLLDGGLAPSLGAAGDVRGLAPEQARGGAPGPRSDLFALGTVLREALEGEPVFEAAGTIERLYAVLHQDPPPLGGDGARAAFGRVIERAMRKDPDARHPDAAAMAAELRAIPLDRDAPAPRGRRAAAPPLRLSVLPFAPAAADPGLAELGAGIADGATLTLSGTHALVVRSPFVAARHGGPTPDLAALAGALGSDLVLWGSLSAAGERCRLDAILVEAPGGAERARFSLDGERDDAFELQDRLARRVVMALGLPLTTREQLHWAGDVPADAAAYAAFLAARARLERGRELVEARDLLERAVAADPGFAPAWVALARARRLVAKYVLDDPGPGMRDATEALARALALRPELAAAHHVLAHHELDSGRVETAIERLLGVVERNPNDPIGHAGLVAAARYAGLLDASLAAHERVTALDPSMMTSVYYTYAALGRWEDALQATRPGFGMDRFRALLHLGRDDEARALVERMEARGDARGLHWMALARAALERDPARLGPGAATFERAPDPEGSAAFASLFARAGDRARALQLVERAVASGYSDVCMLRGDVWLEPVRDDPRFERALGEAETRHRAAAARFARRLRRIPAGAAGRGRVSASRTAS